MDIKGKVSAELEEFIELAGTNGQFTQKQKELILKKAESLGEDMDVVEMILEGVTVEDRKKQSRLQKKGRQCPQCGAYWDESVIKCPECGHVFQAESDKSAQIRKELDEISAKVEKCEFSDERDRVISSITIPVDKESLLHYMEFFLSQVSADDGWNRYSPWLSKAREILNRLQRMSISEPHLERLLDNYDRQIRELEKEKRIERNRMWLVTGIIFIFIFVIIILIIIFLPH